MRRCCHVPETPTGLCGSTGTQLGRLHLHLEQSHSLQGNGKPCVGALPQISRVVLLCSPPSLASRRGSIPGRGHIPFWWPQITADSRHGNFSLRRSGCSWEQRVPFLAQEQCSRVTTASVKRRLGFGTGKNTLSS